jgi:mannose-1-phosphate guanylyltransferase/mannose-6-phosphate isomerase
MSQIKNKLQPVILAGGSGTRLWPISRRNLPKQFNQFRDGKSLFQLTLERAKKISNKIPVIVTNKDTYFIALQQSKEIDIEIKTILEPLAKNTAPAILLASLYVDSIYGDTKIIVLSADHVMEDNSFIELVHDYAFKAENTDMIIFGVSPSYPEVGYGYIETTDKKSVIKKVIKFKEKPTIDLAKEYLEKGNYLWNAGIFLFSSTFFKDAMTLHAPEISNCCMNAINETKLTEDVIRVNDKNFLNCPSISIDYALIEKIEDILVIDIGSSWSDVGTWMNYKKAFNEDKNGNVGDDYTMFEKTKNTFVKSTTSKDICIYGLDNIAVIDTEDALLVMDIKNSSQIGTVVEKYRVKSPGITEIHRKVYRPWGWYDSLDFGKRDQVKRISVRPGERLSLQKHAYRSEHWVVVSGIATVTINETTRDIHPNESVYINVGDIHRLENNTVEPVEIIEVQVGDYLGEDDIVRLEDIYGRS